MSSKSKYTRARARSRSIEMFRMNFLDARDGATMTRDVAETGGVLLESCFQENWITASFTVVRGVETGYGDRQTAIARAIDVD